MPISKKFSSKKISKKNRLDPTGYFDIDNKLKPLIKRARDLNAPASIPQIVESNRLMKLNRQNGSIADISFFRDFSLCPDLNPTGGPRITFTRASGATRVNRAGLVELMGANVPRFDYDPITRQCKGLLVEESRTNLALQSDFNTGISGTGLVTSSTMTGPTGEIINAAAFGYNGSTLSFLYKVTVAASTQYTISVFVRMDDGGAPSFLSATNQDATNDFILVLGNNQVSNPINYIVTNLGNGLYRVSGVGTSSSSNLGNTGILKFTTNSSRTFKTSGWQVEAGSFATSYIPTTSSTVTRSADILTIGGPDFTSWYRPDEGTFFYSLYANGINAFDYLIGVGDGSIANFAGLRANSGSQYRFYIRSNSADQVAIDTVTTTSNVNKFTLALKENDFAVSVNGAAVVTDTSGSMPIPNQFALQNNGTAASSLIISKMVYYSRRLSNSTLQSLTG